MYTLNIIYIYTYIYIILYILYTQIKIIYNICNNSLQQHAT